MKKTYSNPTLEVVKIQTTQMLADSTVGVKGNYNSETITIASRGYDFSLDEE